MFLALCYMLTSMLNLIVILNRFTPPWNHGRYLIMKNPALENKQWLIDLMTLAYQQGRKDSADGIFIDQVDVACNLFTTYVAQEKSQNNQYKPLILNDNINFKPLQKKDYLSLNFRKLC